METRNKRLAELLRIEQPTERELDEAAALHEEILAMPARTRTEAIIKVRRLTCRRFGLPIGERYDTVEVLDEALCLLN